MTDEIKEVEQKECKCFCHSKGFRKFLTIALGTFVGVYCALCLVTALHKPPMMPPMTGAHYHGGFRGYPCLIHHHHFDKIKHYNKGDFKQYPQKGFDAKTPLETKRAELDD